MDNMKQLVRSGKEKPKNVHDNIVLSSVHTLEKMPRNLAQVQRISHDVNADLATRKKLAPTTLLTTCRL